MDLSGNVVAWGWETPESFVKDIQDEKYKKNEKETFQFTDLSGEAFKKQEAMFLKQLKLVQIQRENELSRKVASVSGSNVNWGRITQPNEIGGTTLEELGMQGIKTPVRCAEYYQDINEYLFRHQNRLNFTLDDHMRLVKEGELSAPIVKAIEEEEETDSIRESPWFCKGCSKHFATKSSLKRHHDRKKSCKDLCEEKEKSKEEDAKPEVPAKPYIVDWVDQLLIKSISGDSEKPYCKHCDVEFANKSNLNKHLSKSVACDKLAKQAFLENFKV